MKVNNTKILKVIYYFFIITIIFFGIYWRMRLYLVKAPFWIDEIMLGLSFTDRDLSGMFLPLEADQKAPPLFLCLVYGLVKLFGFNEYIFRLVPFVSSVSAVFLFFIFLKQHIKNKLGILIGMFLFSTCIPLIYYSAEFKPYSCDLLICLILLLSYKYIQLKELSFLRVFLYSIVSIGLVLFSFPCMFIIPAIIFAKSLEEKKFNFKTIFIFLGILAAGLYLYLYDRDVVKYMKFFWCGEFQQGCIELSFKYFAYYLVNSCQFFIYNFNPKFIIFFLLMPFTGLYILYKNNKSFARLIVILFTLIISASVLEIYPSKNRLILYTVPVFIFLIVKIFDYPSVVQVSSKLKYLLNILLCFYVFLSVGISIPYFNVSENQLIAYMEHADRNRSKQDRDFVKEYTKIVIDYINESEVILASDELIYVINYYKHYFKSDKNINIKRYGDITSDEIEKTVVNYLDENKNKSGLWFFGRDNDNYFKCGEFILVSKLLKHYGIKYTYYRNKDLYLIHTFNKT